MSANEGSGNTVADVSPHCTRMSFAPSFGLNYLFTLMMETKLFYQSFLLFFFRLCPAAATSPFTLPLPHNPLDVIVNVCIIYVGVSSKLSS